MNRAMRISAEAARRAEVKRTPKDQIRTLQRLIKEEESAREVCALPLFRTQEELEAALADPNYVWRI